MLRVPPLVMGGPSYLCPQPHAPQPCTCTPTPRPLCFRIHRLEPALVQEGVAGRIL